MPSGYFKPRPWTVAEDAELLRHAAAGLPVPKIAQRIGRTKSAVWARVGRYYPKLRTKLKASQTHGTDTWAVTQRDKDDDLRVKVYETSLGLTRQQVGEALPDVAPQTLDRILNDLTSRWRTQGNWLPPVLRVRADGVYERETDRDMIRANDDKAFWAPRVRKESERVAC